MKEFSKSRTTKKSIIVIVVAMALFIGCLFTAVSLNAPTASGTRETVADVEVYGIGDDDVGIIISDEIFRTRNVSYAADGIVHTDGVAPFVYNGENYIAYFYSDVAQGTGTYNVEFNFNDALNNKIVVHPEENSENCTFVVQIVKDNG